jgi:Protein of unknown function (DUF3987)
MPPDAAGAERVRETIFGADEVQPEPPRPLMRELPPADPFPVDALGDVLGAAASAIHDRVQAPVAICGQSVLAAAALAGQAHADVLLPIGPGQSRPLSLFLVSVAPSGERKSACDAEAMWPIRRRETALREAHDADGLHYANDRAAYDRAREAALKTGKGDRAAIRTALDALGPAPLPPLIPMLTCPEPTYEGMCRLLAAGQPSIGIFAAEGGQFVGGHGMSDEARLRTAAGLSALWDGEPIRRVRVGDGISILPGRRVSLHLMAQPTVADLWLRDRLLIDQGLLSRTLVTAPDSAMGGRLSHDEAPETAPAMARYGARLLSIMETPLPLACERPNELTPRPLALSPVAGRLWRGFADRVETMLTRDGELRPISGIANKLPEHAARIAAVLTLVRHIDAGEIAVVEMAAGIELAQHFTAEALRLHGGSQVSAELQRAEAARVWLLQHWPEPAISLPDLYQRGPVAIRDGKAARQTVTILEEHGWLIRIPQGAEIAGTRRREAWRIVRG